MFLKCVFIQRQYRKEEKGDGEKERAREWASMRNDVWNTSEMLSILGGCPSLNPSLLQFLGFSQQGTNAKAHTYTHTNKSETKSRRTRHPTIISFCNHRHNFSSLKEKKRKQLRQSHEEKSETDRKLKSWCSIATSKKPLLCTAKCNKWELVVHASVFSHDTVPAPFRCLRVNELALKESFKEPC